MEPLPKERVHLDSSKVASDHEVPQWSRSRRSGFTSLPDWSDQVLYAPQWSRSRRSGFTLRPDLAGELVELASMEPLPKERVHVRAGPSGAQAA